jgi:glycosyltransferase involved in cell wall biosynthesis
MQYTASLKYAADTPRISVVIPCFNVEELVVDAVHTVLNQTYPIEEIICIDDGSQDNTLHVLRTLESEVAITVTDLGQQQGASAARNQGLEMVSADYVQFLDADDLLAPSKLEHQATLIAESSFTPDFVAASYNKELLDDAVEEGSGTVPVHSDDWIGLISTELGITSANLWRTASLRAVGGFSEAYDQSTEAELMFRLLCNGAKILRDPTALTTVRRRSDSLWHDTPSESRKSWLRLRWRIQRYLNDNDLLTPERERVLQRQAFVQISALYPHDKDFAIHMHEKIINEAFRPQNEDITVNKIYSFLYSLFGLEWAEEIRMYWHALKKRIGLNSSYLYGVD